MVALTTEFLRAAGALFTAGSVQDTQTRVAVTTVTTVEGCDFAGIFLADGDAITSPVHTGPAAAEADALQRHADEGPCLDAITQSTGRLRRRPGRRPPLAALLPPGGRPWDAQPAGTGPARNGTPPGRGTNS